MLKMKKIVVALITLSAASSVFADDQSGLYFVGTVGQSKLSFDKAKSDNVLTVAGVTGLSSTMDETDIGYKLQLGYQFTPNFAIEGGYVDLGKYTYNATFTGGTANVSARASGWNIVGVGIIPLGDAFSLFGKLGLINAKVDVVASATGPGGSALASATPTDWKATYGIGGAYNISKAASVRIEYDQYKKLGHNDSTGEADVNLFSVGVGYKF